MKLKKGLLSIIVLVLAVPVFFVSGCAASRTENFYAAQYQKALSATPALNLEVEGVSPQWVGERFSEVMNQFKAPDVVERAERIFSKEVYFNDTWHTFTDSAVLGDYLKRTGEKINFIEVLVQDVAINQENAYVRWTMSIKVDEDDVPIESVGMTHLRFDKNKQIYAYQDYWDGIEGFYRALPVLGSVLETIRKKFG